MSKDRYETIRLILKERSDGRSWFDVIDEFISQDCEGGGGECILAEGEDSDCDDHEHTELFPCTCGLETMGGSSGTLEQCFKAETTVGHGLQPIDLAHAIANLYAGLEVDEKILKWAENEIRFEEEWDSEL